MKTTALFLALATSAFAQGPLAPPAAPAPSMKTLDQIEARTPIPAATGGYSPPNQDPHFTITAPGSYYLTGNIIVASRHAIVIADGVNDVTLDLNGFSIISSLGGHSSKNAIDMVGSHSRITIYNGNIQASNSAGFEYGITGGDLKQVLVKQIHVTGTEFIGINLGNQGHMIGYSLVNISLGNQCIISECTAEGCGDTGLVGETVTKSRAYDCRQRGIYAKNVTNCTGSSNRSVGLICTGNAIDSTGISSDGGGMICYGNATNCKGVTYYGTGLDCRGNANSCTGTSATGGGLNCDNNATNCTGTSGVGYALHVTGTANSCKGIYNTPSNIALSAGIAIGCTSTSGSISSPQKHLGTP
jgi:hypothetical protein